MEGSSIILIVFLILCAYIFLSILRKAIKDGKISQKEHPIFECPYEHPPISCIKMDTAGMDKGGCESCPHYNHGVRPTGGFHFKEEKDEFSPEILDLKVAKQLILLNQLSRF